MYNPVIFDLDGTLLNTLGDLADAGNYALKSAGYPTHPEERFKTFVGNGIPNLIRRMLPENASDNEIQCVHTLFSEYYAAHKADRTAPYDGITELLSELKSRGITVLCNTNKQHKYSEQLVQDYFGNLITELCADSGRFPRKPSPEAAVYLAEKYFKNGCKPLYIGDSSVDMQTAKNAGFDVCGVLWGFRTKEELSQYNPTFLAENAAQLREFIFGEED